MSRQDTGKTAAVGTSTWLTLPETGIAGWAPAAGDAGAKVSGNTAVWGCASGANSVEGKVAEQDTAAGWLGSRRERWRSARMYRSEDSGVQASIEVRDHRPNILLAPSDELVNAPVAIHAWLRRREQNGVGCGWAASVASNRRPMACPYSPRLRG